MILYEDKDIIVCHKMAGIAVQSARIGEKDLVSMLNNHLMEQADQRMEPVRVVHRLDQPVEGLLVFAKDTKAAAALSKQLTEGALNKHYYAVLCGYPDCPEGDLVDYLRKEGNVAVAVTGREQEFADAKIAALHYRILEEINAPSPLALADVTIGTGRFHQIRVQFAHAGFPLFGDTKYGTAVLKEAMSAQKYRGVALCAYSLELVHPVSGKKMGFRVVPKNPAFAGFAMEELKKLTENETGISKRG